MSQPEQSLRVLLVGPPTAHLERSRAILAGLGHDVVLVSYDEHHADERAHLPLIDASGRLRTLRSILRLRAQLRRVLRDFRPDVVHAHWLTGPGWIAALAGARPLVVSAWGSDALRWTPGSRLARLLARVVGRRAARVTYDADVVRDALVAAGVPADRVVRLVFGVDTSRFHPGEPDEALLARLGAGHGAPVVLSPRGLDPVYRPEVVVEAFAQIGGAVLLLRVGDAQDALLAPLRARAEQLGVGALLVPYRSVAHEDLPALLRSASVVVSVPESDGTSVLLLETLASETPVIVSDLPANREWVDEGAAPIVPVGDADALAHALRTVLDAQDDARARIAPLAARVRLTASADVERATLSQLYADAIGA